MMKILILLILLSSSIFILSCSENEDAAVREIVMDITVKNKNGENLLDPANPEGYKESEIRLYYLINEEIVEVYDPSKGFPRNFFLTGSNDLRVFANDQSTDDITTTFIKWDANDLDTIKTELDRANNYVQISRVWFNGKLVDSGSDIYFEIIK